MCNNRRHGISCTCNKASRLGLVVPASTNIALMKEVDALNARISKDAERIESLRGIIKRKNNRLTDFQVKIDRKRGHLLDAHKQLKHEQEINKKLHAEKHELSMQFAAKTLNEPTKFIHHVAPRVITKVSGFQTFLNVVSIGLLLAVLLKL